MVIFLLFVHRWLAKDEDDGQTTRELLCGKSSLLNSELRFIRFIQWTFLKIILNVRLRWEYKTNATLLLDAMGAISFVFSFWPRMFYDFLEGSILDSPLEYPLLS